MKGTLSLSRSEATASLAYEFDHWEGLGDVQHQAAGATAVVDVTDDVHATAVFRLRGYFVRARAWPPQGGTVTVTPEQPIYAPGESVTIEATAASDWTFTGWAGTGIDTEGGASQTFNVTEDVFAVACFERTDGEPGKTVWTWGSNDNGRLGDRTTERRFEPIRPLGMPAAVRVDGGGSFTVALAEDGSLCLVGGFSKTSGQYHFPCQPVCPYVGADDVERTLLSGRGTLWGHTTVTISPPGYRGEVPYGFGSVELTAEGLRVVGRLTESEPDRLTYGMAMEVVADVVFTDDDGTEVVTWAFSPVRGDPR